MSKFLSWLSGLVPAEYRTEIAIKKMSYTAGKCLAGVLVSGAAKPYIGQHLSPDQVAQIQTGATVATAALLTAIHDWAKVKWPDVKWL